MGRGHGGESEQTLRPRAACRVGSVGSSRGRSGQTPHTVMHSRAKYPRTCLGASLQDHRQFQEEEATWHQLDPQGGLHQAISRPEPLPAKLTGWVNARRDPRVEWGEEPQDQTGGPCLPGMAGPGSGYPSFPLISSVTLG